MKYNLYHGNCLDVLHLKMAGEPRVKCIFADPPDNINLGYGAYKDAMPDAEYEALLWEWLRSFVTWADIVWFSFNARWTAEVGSICRVLKGDFDLEFKPCVQTFTFGQNNKHDLGNGHRPLWRLRRKDAPLYPDSIKVPSWRQLNGDKRAAPGGRVPLDVFDFPRVTGNSKQRRSHHPTQLHEGLVERCIRLSTGPDDQVIDPFGGTGTTLRVCKAVGRSCAMAEFDRNYCEHIANENCLTESSNGVWVSETDSKADSEAA